MSLTAPARMYDSASPGGIPHTATLVAGYIDGRYRWSVPAWDSWPSAERVMITVEGSPYANVADVENGNLTPADGARWIDEKHAAGMRGATLYCNRSSLEAVWAACHGRAYYLIVADWTGEPHLIPHTIGTQYYNQPEQLYDLSEIYSQAWLDVISEQNATHPVPWQR